MQRHQGMATKQQGDHGGFVAEEVREVVGHILGLVGHCKDLNYAEFGTVV